MREILFRGKSIDNGEWIEGGYAQIQPPPVCFSNDNDTEPPKICIVAEKGFSDWGLPRQYAMYDVIPSTVGQYTGLTDKNEKKIFEGDIVRTHYANASKADFIEQVVFRSGRFCALYQLPERGKMWAGLADGTTHLPQEKVAYMAWCEVIGNIHDNPELLEDDT